MKENLARTGWGLHLIDRPSRPSRQQPRLSRGEFLTRASNRSRVSSSDWTFGSRVYSQPNIVCTIVAAASIETECFTKRNKQDEEDFRDSYLFHVCIVNPTFLSTIWSKGLRSKMLVQQSMALVEAATPVHTERVEWRIHFFLFTNMNDENIHFLWTKWESKRIFLIHLICIENSWRKMRKKKVWGLEKTYFKFTTNFSMSLIAEIFWTGGSMMQWRSATKHTISRWFRVEQINWSRG